MRVLTVIVVVLGLLVSPGMVKPAEAADTIGPDEMFFYHDDGLFAFYNVRSDGSLAAKLSSGTGYTKGWSQITSVDFDGDPPPPPTMPSFDTAKDIIDARSRRGSE